ncbi:hypothetical protein ACOSP7_026913 [Xanthoceras sorbifolium]
MNNRFLQWEKTYRLLVCWFQSKLNPTMIGQVTKCVTSCEIWIVLKRMYLQHSLRKIMQIRAHIQATKKDSMSITKYILKIKILADSLAVAGQPMNDRDLLLNVLQGVSSECDTVIVTITTQQCTVSFQDAQFLLMSYEARLNQHTSFASLALAMHLLALLSL